MPPRYPRLRTLLAAVLLITCVAWSFSTPAEAKGKKGKAVSRSRKQIASSKRSSKKPVHRGRRSNNFSEDDVAAFPASYTVVPDRIEVIEAGSAPAPELVRLLNPPLPRIQPTQDLSDPDLNASISQARRKSVSIDPARALQIQQALTQRGFYTGELTGVYDEATIEAMRRFQASEKIPATGYPTAHALKRLGLTNW